MTELTSSRLGAGFEMTLISSERRRVLDRVGETMVSEAGFGIVRTGGGRRNDKEPRERRRAMFQWLQRFFRIGNLAAGARGERRAAEWLQQEKGYAVVARNWRSPRDRREEIDLVCRDGEVLVFVEVKARTAGARVPGYFAVNERKKRVLRRAIDAYLKRLAHRPRTIRFDVVEIVHEGGDAKGGERVEVLHFENVALFSKEYRRGG